MYLIYEIILQNPQDFLRVCLIKLNMYYQLSEQAPDKAL